MSLMGGMSFHYLERKVSREEINTVADKLNDKKYTLGCYVWNEPRSEEQMA